MSCILDTLIPILWDLSKNLWWRLCNILIIWLCFTAWEISSHWSYMCYMVDIRGDINIIFNSRMELRYDWLIESLEITRGIHLFHLHYIYYKTTCLVRNAYKLFTTFSKNTRTHISLYVSIEWMFHTLPSKELHLQ